ncbi:MAG TPA: right-handed parallel beta-helix repeat-containing protein [archaeon]|nr:right-handed parallel beta-helix repeat-containing protein [archaeon]
MRAGAQIAMLLIICLTGPAEARWREDYNGDGRVNILDAVSLLILAREHPEDPAADYDSDGRCTKNDAIALLLEIINSGMTSARPGDYEHRELQGGAIAVTGPGSCGEPGATYMLAADISSPVSAVFLGRDVTLDLNGYTITYADIEYEHVPNYGFEDGLDGWDVSGAPGAKVRDTKTTQTFIGDKILYLPYGEEIASSYINLPVADRAYYAMCGVAATEMRVTINVDDEGGNPVNCTFTFDGNTRQTCSQENSSPKLGGGFVFALLHDLPAGKYRIRVKAETSSLIDEVDIRPALDVGVGIVENTYPWAYYKCILDGDYTAFFDYTREGTYSTPVESVPRVTGSGTITIKNGVVRSGAVGIRSWGVQSTAEDVTVIIENVRFEASGINTQAVDVPQAVIRNCRFEIDNPFIIDRHRTDDQVVNLRGWQDSEIYDCEFLGGQGCLTLRGDHSVVYNNRFVNRQTVTNHYSIDVTGASTKIYNNRFEPETGSGILIGTSHHIEVFDNLFRIEASPPTCEYGNESYSVNAVRITDYNAEPSSGDVARENYIYNNEFYITGRDYPERSGYIPMAYAVFLSVGGGTNYFYDNQVVVEHLEPESKALASAFYIGSSNNGGEWHDNTVTSNVPAIWVASMYGSAANAKFSDNTIVKGPNAPENFKPVRMGWWEYTARNIEFRSNKFEGADFALEATDQDHSYKVYWTLTVNLVDQDSKPLADLEVVIADKNGQEAARGNTDQSGKFSTELLEYEVSGRQKTISSPYIVKAAGKEETVVLNKNTELTITQQ